MRYRIVYTVFVAILAGMAFWLSDRWAFEHLPTKVAGRDLIDLPTRDDVASAEPPERGTSPVTTPTPPTETSFASEPTRYPDFFADAPVLDERWRTDDSGDRLIHDRLVSREGAFRTVRITETWSTDDEGNADRLLSHEAIVGDHVLVQFSPEIGREEITRLAEAAGLAVRRFLRKSGLTVVATRVDSLDAPEKAIEAVEQFGDLVEFAEPDPIVRASETVPQDPFYAQQWHLADTTFSIHAGAGWSIRREAPEIVVAVIDTGTRLDHEDLAGNLWINVGEIASNGIDDDHNGYVDDVRGVDIVNGDGDPSDDAGHGTAVAGVIGARGNNGKGVSGIAWRVQIMSVKFLNEEGLGTVSDSIDAIDYAVENGAQLINASWSNDWRHPTGSQAEAVAIERARAAGVIFVAAAGNDGRDIDYSPVFPASFTHDNVVTVAAYGENGRLEDFSNRGVSTVDVAAPGNNILTLSNTSATATGEKSGTSLAAPVITGMLALIRAEFPDEDYRSWINRLLASIDPVSEPYSADLRWLSGRVRAAGTPRLDHALSRPAAPVFPQIVAGRSFESYSFITGDDLTISGLAEIGAPLTYRLYRNGSVILEAPGQLQFSSLTTLDEGLYEIEAFNGAGSTFTRLYLDYVRPNYTVAKEFGLPEIPWSDREEAIEYDQENRIEGRFSAGMSVIDIGEKKEIEATIQGPGVLTFYLSRNFPGGDAVFEVIVNESVFVSLTDPAVGDWEKVRVPVPGSRNKVKIVLRKPGRATEARYSFRIDEMRWETDKPHFTRQPESYDGVLGGAVRLEAQCAGARPLSYQWYRNGRAIDGASAPTLDIPVSDSGDVGRYWLTVSNERGTATSEPVVVRLLELPEPPAISVEPMGSFTSHPGRDYSRTVTVSGTQPLTITWYRSGVPLYGFDGTEIWVPGASNEELGDYRIVVEGPGGRASADIYPGLISDTISVETYPRKLEVFEGDPFEIRFRVTAKDGVDSQFVVWTRNRKKLAGEKGTAFAREAAVVGDDGIYTARIDTYQNGKNINRVTLGPVRVRIVRPVSGIEAAVADADLPWRTAARAPWSVQEDPEGTRGEVLRSASIAAEEESILSLAVSGPAVVQFDARVSSEPYADGIEVRLDDQLVRWITGEKAWDSYAVEVPEGAHRLEWAYVKDGAGDFGEDAGWLDALVLVADPPALVSPRILRAVVGEDTTLSILADAAQAVTVTGLPAGMSYDPETRVISGRPSEEAEYELTVVLEGGGASVTETVLLKVQPSILPYRSFTYPFVARPNGKVRRMVHGAGHFVAVGNDRLLAYSADGFRWDYVVPDWPPANMRDVIYGGGLFVAVGDVGILYTSQDGENWRRLRQVPRYTLNAVAFGNGRFLAVGDVGIVLASTDGESWVAHFTAERETMVGVGWVGDRFIGVDRLGRIYESIDGAAWTITDDRGGELLGYAMVANHGIVGRPEPGQNWDPAGFSWRGYSADDGWSVTGTVGGRPVVGFLDHDSERFLVANDVSVWGSVNGVAWTKVTHNPTRRNHPIALCWTGDGWFRWDSELQSSADGRDWSTESPPSDWSISGDRVVSTGKRVFAKGFTSWYSSVDGRDWELAHGLPEDLVQIRAIDARFIGESSRPGGLYVSDDGSSWAWVPNNVSKPIRDTLFVDGYFYGVTWEDDGQWRFAYRSSDLMTWEVLTARAPIPLISFAHVRGRFYAGGREGQVLASDDCVAWEVLNSGVGAPGVGSPRGFVDAGGVIVAYGNGGYIVTSHDGQNWFQRRSPTGVDFKQMVYDGRVFILISREQFVIVSADGINWQAAYLPVFKFGSTSLTTHRGSLFVVGDGGGLVQLGEALPAMPPSYHDLSPHFSPPVGGTVKLSVEAMGEGPFSYSWMKNGVEIPEAEKSWLDIETFSAEAAGEYAVRIANDFGEITSAPVIVAPAATVVPGVYRGRIRNEDNSGEDGEFALWIRDDGTAVFLGLREDGVAVVDENLVVTADGRITEPAVGAAFAGDTTNRVLAVGTDLGVVGSVGLRSFFGARVGPADAKLLEGVVAYSSGVRVRALQPASGEGFVLVSGGDSLAITLPEAADEIGFATDAGAYQVSLIGTGIAGTFVSANASSWPLLAVGTEETDGAVLANISTRGEVQAGDSMLIAGFVVQGSGTRRLLIRAAGPALAEFGVADPLSRPRIELKSAAGEDLGQNAGWGGSELVTELNLLTGAFDFAPGSEDAALVATLSAGSYTAQISGADGGRGVSLAEVYDGDLAAGGGAKVVNISTRGAVSGTSTFLISGFVVTGNQPRLVLVRGIGPALGEFGLSGFLPDPELEVFDTDSRSVRFNDDWDEGNDAVLVSESAEQVGAFALTPGAADAAALMWLAPGAYTVHVRSSDNRSGVALAEIYEVP